MGRWSREVAQLFIDWLGLSSQLSWLDVGCGTGALSSAICKRLEPRSLVGCDPSPEFISVASSYLTDCPATFVVSSAQDLPRHGAGFDAVVSGLVLNFLPEPLKAVRSMRDRLRPGGTLAAYVWDYAEGMQFLRVFWDAAVAVDSSALHEARRFPLCQPDRLAELFERGRLHDVATTSLQIETVFRDFEDFWSPFLAGTGPGPSFVASLAPNVQSRLAQRLRKRLLVSADGSIRLAATAFAVRGVRPG
jgi:SAM-dependent methyltransferase